MQREGKGAAEEGQGEPKSTLCSSFYKSSHHSNRVDIYPPFTQEVKKKVDC